MGKCEVCGGKVISPGGATCGARDCIRQMWERLGKQKDEEKLNRYQYYQAK